MGRLGFVDEVTARLDPVLVPRGFAPGQGDDSQVIFCGSFDELAARFPQLPQIGEQQRGTGACIDLVVTAADHAGWASIRLEGTTLEETLHRAGHSELADAVRAAHHTTLPSALDEVASALRALFPEEGTTPGSVDR